MTKTQKKVLQRALEFVVGVDHPVPEYAQDRRRRIDAMKRSNEQRPCEYSQAQIIEAETGVSFEDALKVIRSVAE
tara:strand:+ start:661 stop:885 length:225 start_codon:yes stop_codon:yes gene_type:complete